MAFLPTDFTQVNFKLNQKMVSLAIDLLELNDDDEVIDLFCGLGNFTLPSSSFTLNGSRCRKMSTVLFSATATSNWGTCDLIESFSIALPNAYRRKARLGVRFVAKKDKVLVGFREKKSGWIANMDRCEVLHPSIGQHLVALGSAIEKLSIKSQVPQLEVAIAENNTVLILRHLINHFIGIIKLK
jgi:tRNA/tmRNA/rRNA uracil-C5-methylase (TrmA/RlmC/RlmD family)